MTDFPDAYSPLNYCRGCSRDFTSPSYFDRHRVGRHEPLERRCMTEEELHASGLRPVAPGDSERHDARLAFSVPLWWDPENAEQVRRVRPQMSAARASTAPAKAESARQKEAA